MTVSFWNWFKKSNSTSYPTGTAADTFTVTLKDSSSVLNPVLEIYEGSSFNPSSYNYAYIASFQRYYYVTDWTWIVGRWEASLTVDALASYKVEIGQQTKYVLRSSYDYTPQAIDDFYPSLGARYSNYVDVDSFSFTRDMASGIYILGVANASGYGAGAITYYALSSSQIRDLVQFMLPLSTDAWNTTFAGMTDTLYRAIYSPFDYIKSCRWYPLTPTGSGTSVLMMFGNYSTSISATLLPDDASTWGYGSRTLDLPTGWISRDAKYKVNPNVTIHLVVNPWGIIDINPMDVLDASQIVVRCYPDFISGECMLKVFKEVGSSTYFITQKSARIAMDINLSASSINAQGMISGVMGAAGAAATIATGGSAAVAGGILSAAGSVITAASSAIPTMSASVGQINGNVQLMDGEIQLIVTEQYFADEDNAEFGKPLLESRQLSTIPGYIKCADAHVIIDAFPDEVAAIEDAMTNGFFYE